MDKFPATKGRRLIIPREPVDYAFDLSDETYLHCQKVAKKIVKAIDKALNPVRTCMVIEGFEVPHAHIKLFPCYEKNMIVGGGEMADDSELEKIASQIREAL